MHRLQTLQTLQALLRAHARTHALTHTRSRAVAPALRSLGSMAAAAAGPGELGRAKLVLDRWVPGWSSMGPVELNGGWMKMWYSGGEDVDKDIRDNFMQDWTAMRDGKLEAWLDTPQTTLAGIIVMDQFSRNMFRGTKEAFALDAKALSWAKHMLDKDMLPALPRNTHMLVFLPFMHSEDLAEQERGVELWQRMAAELEPMGEPAAPLLKMVQMSLKFAIDHRDVIKQWGRFPHRNAAVGRQSTPEELKGLADKTIASW